VTKGCDKNGSDNDGDVTEDDDDDDTYSGMPLVLCWAGV
jgi:hypothetical protein